MADELDISSDLTRQFAQLGDIQNVSARLSSRLAHISQLNHTAAGTDDDYATAYHKNVDANQQNLVDLVDGIGSLFDTTGANGQAVSKSFDAVDEDATSVAGSMNFDSASFTAASRTPASAALPFGESSLTPALSERLLGTPVTPLTQVQADAPTGDIPALNTPAMPLTRVQADAPTRDVPALDTPAMPLRDGIPAQSDRMLGVTPAPLLARSEAGERMLGVTPAPLLARSEAGEQMHGVTPAPLLARSEAGEQMLGVASTPALPLGDTTEPLSRVDVSPGTPVDRS